MTVTGSNSASKVGIIANPSAGKDIRRLVAQATTFDNNEKVNIVRRLLLGLDATGVAEAVIMPDSFGIGVRALNGLRLSLSASILEMEPEFTQTDSTRAAALMRAGGAGCIVTLGGDGTNRAVAKGCGTVPLLPISTGTNNVFPQMIEGTVAGLAAGVIAAHICDTDAVVRPSLRLDVLRDGEIVDIALVDVVASDDRFIGSRAVWDERKIRQIILTRADPAHTGFSSVGGNLGATKPDSQRGLALTIGDGGRTVLAPIAPGLIRPIPIAAARELAIGQSVEIEHAPAVLALDGEREIEVRPGERVSVRLSAAGPRVVDVRAALEAAARRGFFVM